MLYVGNTKISYNENNQMDIEVFGAQNIGTINYTTGACVINQSVNFGYVYYYPQVIGGPVAAWDEATGSMSLAIGLTSNYAWIKESGTSIELQANTLTKTTTEAPLYFDLTNETTQRIVPNSLMFSLAGKTYIDRSGVLRREWRGVKVPEHARQVLDFVKTL